MLIFFSLSNELYKNAKLEIYRNNVNKNTIVKLDTQKLSLKFILNDPAGNYMFKVNSRNTRTRCEICSKLRIKTPERRHC